MFLSLNKLMARKCIYLINQSEIKVNHRMTEGERDKLMENVSAVVVVVVVVVVYVGGRAGGGRMLSNEQQRASIPG